MERPDRRRGFTLIEMMVVLVVVGLVAGGISLGLNGFRAREERNALERLRRVLEATAQRAEVRGQPLAFEMLADGYRFWALASDGNWQLLVDPPVYNERVLPAGMVWEAVMSGSGRVSGERCLEFGSHPTDFELRLSTPHGVAVYRGKINGEVTLVLPEDG
ncbi:MAG: prepilin-type N-terminal cleavage/methylation domain-containing protein [Candidatus Accumulibacter sp.]|jgi:general secretion pathway protein H|uniref:prepilin-type N-terminal cleavage/methylation domain-containing protein n=1 Tax=Accumulibacter sp. TaxID=2053492 RepID=UPI001AC923DB|nr:prepilin-type N-terminal cleavage/methylation domain-containing protein [Accumulibacter sp.]MBN8439826.1 prepilin-type N-terminal cleavage/methylation domain-containing protein [Accumulibacter sp.]